MEASIEPFASVAHARSMEKALSRSQRGELIKQSRNIPRTSEARLQGSLCDTPIDIPSFLDDKSFSRNSKGTFLYLGYGSNLSSETFLGKRNIKPLSQTNVLVPELALTFNLPGIPYTEPCFANSRYRTVPPSTQGGGPLSVSSEKSEDYHKDHWQKGLVGVVYEVTATDYAHIIATEGGGSGYQDVLADCYPLSPNPREKVPVNPKGNPFKAHTLFAPVTAHSSRPDPSYAQPSPRYMKLLTDGAAEHSLPYEYQSFLHGIRFYRMTTTKQRLGRFIFTLVWSPIFLFMFGGAAKIFLRKDGTYPEWFARFMRAVFTACWASYDGFFKETFGDGERTIGDENDDGDNGGGGMSEKAPLIRESINRYGVGGRLETMA